MLAELYFSWEGWLGKGPQLGFSVYWQFCFAVEISVSLAVSMDASLTGTPQLPYHMVFPLGLSDLTFPKVQPPFGPLKMISPSESELT